MEQNNTVKPPLGLTPRWLRTEIRISEINQAIERYNKAEVAVPTEWTDELTELEAYLENRRNPNKTNVQ